MRKGFLVGLTAVLSLAACKKEGEGGRPAAGTQPAGASSLLDGFDSQAELQVLQGAWQIRDSLAEKTIWVISGDKVSRKKGDQSTEGKIEISCPGQVVFVQTSAGGSMREYFAYSRNGKDIYLGLGTAGMKVGDRYLLAADGLVVKDSSSCKYFKKEVFGDRFEKTGVDVNCELKDEGGKQILSYEVPDPFNKGQMAEREVNIVGGALLDDQMMANKAEKATTQSGGVIQ